ncbi:lipocalin-like domain-containing protein [Streptomyces sp. SID10853]|uniref:lipocalin-like domain-containing protein n=1 Tax=Streptomyces sp. SID10853 TaxID=2706028 RepID=UPI0013BFF972|nr:lipocalin-like domain-containing protein [Streptomyces sp. SID10853]NDZ79373.1 lipocalin-like domain-containing protein [Streptomyces sp. SID10853]
MLSEKDLVGVWSLVSHHYLNTDGSTSEGPLGPRADGLLIYHPDGYMAASMMRTRDATESGGVEASTPSAAYLGSVDDYLSYSGRWQVRDGVVVHEVSIGSHARVINTRQVREVILRDEFLTLRRCLDETSQYVVMDWRKA